MLSKKPILFSTTMVESILKNRKTNTRRALNPQPVLSADNCPDRARLVNALSGTDEALFYFWKTFPLPGFPENTEHISKYCPYGRVGDILWVREEHYRFGHWESEWGVKTATGREKWMFITETEEVRYFDNPPAEFRGGRHHKDPHTSAWHKRLARFMPYKACRLFLEITDIRVEHLQDISEEDAIREGIINRGPLGFTSSGFDQSQTAVSAFKYLWESINGFGSWKRNDWVWVVSFEKTDKPE